MARFSRYHQAGSIMVFLESLALQICLSLQSCKLSMEQIAAFVVTAVDGSEIRRENQLRER